MNRLGKTARMMKAAALAAALVYAALGITGCGGGGSGTSVASAVQAANSYVTASTASALSDYSETCGRCHQTIYNDFLRTGHPYKARKYGELANQSAMGLPAPPSSSDITTNIIAMGYAGVTDANIGYIVGGYKWKIRFMNTTGYIYTGSKGQFNLGGLGTGTSQWVSYNAFPTGGTPTKPFNYSCFRCHTTGAIAGTDYTKSFADPAGTGGSFSAGGIQCEACHGKGSRHVNFRDPMSNTELTDKGLSLTSSLLCGSCHYRNNPTTCDEEPNTSPLLNYNSATNPDGLGTGATYSDTTTACQTSAAWDTDVIIASGGNLKHHEQYQEFVKGPHGKKGLECVSCHDPHKPADDDGIRATCQSCHEKQKNDLAANGGSHKTSDCKDCHMPKMVKNAINNYSLTTAEASSVKLGDIRTHIVKIDDTQSSMFNAAGTAVNIDSSGNAVLSVREACQTCHAATGDTVNGDTAGTQRTLVTLQAAALLAKTNKNHKFQ